MDVPDVLVDVYGATLTLLPPAIVVAAFVAVIRRLTSRLFSQIVKRWVESAAYVLMASAGMYLWGVWHLFAFYIEETCRLTYHEPYDPDYGQAKWFPLERKCNASFDMVPGYVNPAVIILLMGAVVLVGFAVRAAHMRRKTPASYP